MFSEKGRVPVKSQSFVQKKGCFLQRRKWCIFSEMPKSGTHSICTKTFLTRRKPLLRAPVMTFSGSQKGSSYWVLIHFCWGFRGLQILVWQLFQKTEEVQSADSWIDGDPETGLPPVIIHFNGFFPYKPSSNWGTPIYGKPKWLQATAVPVPRRHCGLNQVVEMRASPGLSSRRFPTSRGTPNPSHGWPRPGIETHGDLGIPHFSNHK